MNRFHNEMLRDFRVRLQRQPRSERACCSGAQLREALTLQKWQGAKPPIDAAIGCVWPLLQSQLPLRLC